MGAVSGPDIPGRAVAGTNVRRTCAKVRFTLRER